MSKFISEDMEWCAIKHDNGDVEIGSTKADGYSTICTIQSWCAEEYSSLIEHAPDLYEALEDMIKTFDGYQGMKLTKAKQALSKARGEVRIIDIEIIADYDNSLIKVICPKKKINVWIPLIDFAKITCKHLAKNKSMTDCIIDWINNKE